MENKEIVIANSDLLFFSCSLRIKPHNFLRHWVNYKINFIPLYFLQSYLTDDLAK